jgi:hypothetical protein
MLPSVKMTRAQYDRLLMRFPEWMEEHWPKRFNRNWYIGGVTVSSTVENMAELKDLLERVS